MIFSPSSPPSTEDQGRPLFGRHPKWILVVALFFCLFGSRTSLAQDPPPLSALLRKLGHRRYETRQEASLALVKRGEKALSALRAAQRESKDPEVRLRSQFIIRHIIQNIRVSRSTGLRLAFIDFGAANIGSSPQERGRRGDEQLHMIYIEKPFLMGRYEVTQAEFQKVMKRNPSYFSKTGLGARRLKNKETKQFPVDSVSWFDALEFCNKLSALDGFPKYYELTKVKRERGSIASAQVRVLGGKGYRLPTESEWEYACRARTTSAYHFGERSQGADGNFRSRKSVGAYGMQSKTIELKRSCRVGRYNPNAFGLYDMHGNVAEWCWDWYREQYPKRYQRAGTGPKAGKRRVVRGGSWILNAKSCRSASRASHGPFAVKNYCGFRVARTP